MQLHQHITIQVNAPRLETDGERQARVWRSWAETIERVANHRVKQEKAAGNPLFQNIETWEQYRLACEEDDKRKEAQRRKELGFWRYHFFG